MIGKLQLSTLQAFVFSLFPMGAQNRIISILHAEAIASFTVRKNYNAYAQEMHRSSGTAWEGNNILR